LLQGSEDQVGVDEVMAIVDRYETRRAGWNVRHFYGFCHRDGGTRSYNWVGAKLQRSLPLNCGAPETRTH